MKRLEASEDGRYIINTLDPEHGRWANHSEFCSETEQLCRELAAKIRRQWLDHPSTWKDLDVYTGVGGVLFSQFKLSGAPHCAALTDSLAELVLIAKHKHQLRVTSRRAFRPAFLDGISGFFATLALCSPSDREGARSQFVELSSQFLRNDQEAFEMLYGTAGYLHGLLLIHHFCGADSLLDRLLLDTLRHIVNAGTRSAEFTQRGVLAYRWHGKMYLGSAHGLCGILLQLLYGIRALEHTSMAEAAGARESGAEGVGEFIARSKQIISTTIDYLLELQLPSGNLPSNPDSNSDRLIQWCQGSVGIVPLLCVASEVLKQPQLLQRATSFADTVWERGLLWKGTGLCHGISGNGYTFLTMYRHTQDEAWLRKARAFACFANEHIGALDTPDKAWSLFEGRVG